MAWAITKIGKLFLFRLISRLHFISCVTIWLFVFLSLIFVDYIFFKNSMLRVVRKRNYSSVRQPKELRVYSWRYNLPTFTLRFFYDVFKDSSILISWVWNFCHCLHYRRITIRVLNYFQSAVIPSYSTEQGKCFAYKFSIFHLFYDEMVHWANFRTFHKFMASSKNGVMFRVQDSLCHEVWHDWIFLHKMYFWHIYCHISTFLLN